jgi:hypothetical protein
LEDSHFSESDSMRDDIPLIAPQYTDLGADVDSQGRYITADYRIRRRVNRNRKRGVDSEYEISLLKVLPPIAYKSNSTKSFISIP